MGEAGPSAVAGEVDSEEGEFAADVRVDVDCLSPDADVAGTVGNGGGPEQLVPVRAETESGVTTTARAPSARAFATNELTRKREERLAMKSAAGRASGAGPAGPGYGKGVFSLGAGLGV